MIFSSKDLQHAGRALVRAPLFVFAVVLPFALGIGASTAIFSVADALLRQPLPFPAMDHLVLMTELSPSRASYGVTPANFLDWRTQTRSFESMAAFAPGESALTGIGTPQSVNSASVTNDFFSTLGVTPLMGRLFTPKDIVGDQENSVVLGYGFWEQRFAGNPDIVGREISLDSAKYTVIGILKKGSGFPLNTDIWRPLVLGAHDIQDRSTHNLQLLARLKADVSLAKVQAEMKQVTGQLASAYPETNQGWGSRVVALSDLVSNGLTARYTMMMMGAVLFVLLIVCANVANLQLVRGIVRKREWSLRYALGASRWDIIRLLLMESIALALISGGLAICFANVSVRLIRINMPASIARFVPGFDQISLNLDAVLFTLGLAIFSAVASGLLPALYASRTDIQKELKEGGKGSTSQRSHGRASAILLVGEVAVTLMLLVGTGLMVRGTNSIRQNFAGMHPDQVLTCRIHLADPQYATPVDSLRFYRTFLEQFSRTPGVMSAAVATDIPYGESSRSTAVTVQDAPVVKLGQRDAAMVQIVSPDFFKTLGISVRGGRVFQVGDNEDAAGVVIISQQFVRRYWPNKDPIGRQIRLGSQPAQTPWLRVVGVADDVHYNWLNPDPESVVYRPFAQAQQRSAFLLFRTLGDPEQFAPLLRQQVTAIDQNQPISEVQSWTEVISQSMIGLSYVRVMMLVLAVLAMAVASLGLYGLMSYTVATKRNDIGIRLALGAQRSQILKMVIGKAMLITNLGLAIGLLGSFVITRTLANLVFGISALDPWTFGGASVMFIGIALIASYWPARQASRVDPLDVLRAQ
jgi:putative ABC transport system permease protein